MSVQFEVRLRKRFPVRALPDRIGELTELREDLRAFALSREVARGSVTPDPLPAETLEALCGPGVDQPRGILRVVAAEGVADLHWIDIGLADDPDGGVWLTVSASGRDEAATLLAANVSIAAAQLGRSTVVDSDRLLERGGHIDADTLLHELRSAAPAGLRFGSEQYAAAVLKQVRGPLRDKPSS